MELRHLRYFVAVAEEENVTRAAARLHVSQPPLSRQIRDLEEELGVTLFERSVRALKLTEAGRIFFNEARAVLERAAEAVQTVRVFVDGRSQELHVGYAPALTVEILPPALRRFADANPGVRVHLHDLSTEEMLQGLHEGKLDLALLARAAPKVAAEFIFEEIRRYSVCLATNPAHPLARARTVDLARIARERLIAYTRPDYPEYHAWLDGVFAPIGVSPHIAEQHDSATSLIAAVEAGRGVALVLECFKRFVGTRLKLRTVVPAPPGLVVGAAYPRTPKSVHVTSFLAATKGS